MKSSPPIKGRGSHENPDGRFEAWSKESEDDGWFFEEQIGAIKTQTFFDRSKSILTQNDSPDIGFEVSVNPYRGCEHGCSYCYARPTHEYLGLSAGLDFETKIGVKTDAPALLRKRLSSIRYEPKVIAMSGVTDCYQPLEEKHRLTRGCLEVLRDFRNPVAIITKNFLVTRDLDILRELAKFEAAQVFLSITTLSDDLAGKLEPRASRPRKRLEAVEILAGSGIPVGVMVAPVIPALTDHEMFGILKAAREAGAYTAHFVPLRLPYSVKSLFTEWLEAHFPERKAHVLSRIQQMRSGKLNDSEFHSRMRGSGIFADQLRAMFRLAKKRAGFTGESHSLSVDHFRRPGAQLDMFED